MADPPTVNRRIIEALLADELAHDPRHRLVLVYGRYEDTSPTEFTAEIGAQPRRVRVSDQQSVLGIIEAWQQHQATSVDGTDVLVVTTGVADAQLGWDLRGHAVRRSTRTVDRGRIVAHRFGATDVDPRIRRETWLVDALLDAEPACGWPRCGSVLTRDVAVRALVEARLSSETFGNGALDADALLAWSRTSAGPARFAALPEPERAGLTEWLTEKVGDAAPVLLGLAAAGRAGDAMALGVLGSVLATPGASAEAALSFGNLLGGLRLRPAQLRAFTHVVEGTLERWVSEAEPGAANGPGNGHPQSARDRVSDVLRRADELAAAAELTEALTGNKFLPSTFQTRLRTLATALGAALTSPPGSGPSGGLSGGHRPDPAAVATTETALSELFDHHLAALHPQRTRAAWMAVRLLRWLATPVPSVTSVAAGVRRHLAQWGWVDRALTVLWVGDPVGDPVVGEAYRSVYQAARARRDHLDHAFAQRLTGWTEHACAQAAGGCLLIEQVLEQIALPLATRRAPLIVVLDGMSSAVATELGEQLSRRSLVEATPEAGQRIAAVSALPSVTRVSRASLLTGGLISGDQATERDGFAAFWRRHRRGAAQPPGTLFHKGEIGGPAGHRLADHLVAALAGDGAVGVVLNTVDDALAHGREGDRVEWRIDDITYLPELLNAARAHARPVLLVSDHGHVLDHSAHPVGPVAAPGVESARWRTGTPQDGEVALTGPRVREGGGHIVAPWRGDLRYTQRKAGYHGGASAAEMTVPVLVLLPSSDLLPTGWATLPPEDTTPDWWTPRPAAEPAPPPVVPAARRRATSKPPEGMDALFTPAPAAPTPSPGAPASTLGSRVVATEAFAAQRGFVKKAPDRPVVAAIIDALAETDGSLSLTAVAAKAGRRAGRDPEVLATVLQRLLNVEGYPVLSLIDGGRTMKLDLALLRLQFGLDPTVPPGAEPR